MGVWMRNLEILVEQRHVFHSLRHNAKHRIRNGIGGGKSKLISDKQCGHAPSSVGDGSFPSFKPASTSAAFSHRPNRGTAVGAPCCLPYVFFLFASTIQHITYELEHAETRIKQKRLAHLTRPLREQKRHC